MTRTIVAFLLLVLTKVALADPFPWRLERGINLFSIPAKPETIGLDRTSVVQSLTGASFVGKIETNARGRRFVPYFRGLTPDFALERGTMTGYLLAMPRSAVVTVGTPSTPVTSSGQWALAVVHKTATTSEIIITDFEGTEIGTYRSPLPSYNNELIYAVSDDGRIALRSTSRLELCTVPAYETIFDRRYHIYGPFIGAGLDSIDVFTGARRQLTNMNTTGETCNGLLIDVLGERSADGQTLSVWHTTTSTNYGGPLDMYFGIDRVTLSSGQRETLKRWLSTTARCSRIRMRRGFVYALMGNGSQQEIYRLPGGMLTNTANGVSSFDITLDGQWIAYSPAPPAGSSNTEVFVMRPDGSENAQRTNNGVADTVKFFLPDGRIVFNSQRTDPNGQDLVMNIDGSVIHPLFTSVPGESYQAIARVRLP